MFCFKHPILSADEQYNEVHDKLIGLNYELKHTSTTGLVRDITFEKEFMPRYPQFEDTSKVTIQKLETALDNLATDEVVVDEDGESAPLCLYTQNNTVTRKVAEQMISTYLHTKYGFNCKFKWKKPRFITIPM